MGGGSGVERSQRVSQGFRSVPPKVTGTNLPSSKRPPHRRKCELCFQLNCCACGQHARERGLNFASLCKGLNNKKRAVSPFKVINRMKVLLQPVVVLLHEAALALGAQSEEFCGGILTALWKTAIFLLNVNGSLTWSQLELQNRAYNNDLCIKCGWSVIFIILMCFWCSVSRRTAAKWHWNQLWTCACVHALAMDDVPVRAPNNGVWVMSSSWWDGVTPSASGTLICSQEGSVLSAAAFLPYLWKIDPYGLFRDLHQILILPICSM